MPTLLPHGPTLQLFGKTYRPSAPSGLSPHAIKTYAQVVETDKSLPRHWPL